LVELEDHYESVVDALMDGEVVPLLGAGVNLYDRPAEGSWRAEGWLPSGRELAEHLADTFEFPKGEELDLLRVAQWAVVKERTGGLYRALRRVFNADYEPNPVHRFMAGLPTALRSLGAPSHPLLITTNYDDALEKAFDEVGEPYDVLWYVAERASGQGMFWHRRPDGEPELIPSPPKKYEGISLDERSVILKIHGAVDREDRDRDSYVITEDHYIDYLTRTEVDQLLPNVLLTVLRHSSFLFLGYSMRDWNLRVILHRIWGQQPLGYKSWAIQKDPSEIDRQLWAARHVDVLDVPLAEYIEGFEAYLRAPAPSR
jgi:SIR2-like protein